MASERRIVRIVPINLKRRKDRLIAYWGALQVNQIPLDLVTPFEAHDAKDYPSNFEIRSQAEIDFPFFSKLSREWLSRDGLGKGSFCCLWSMLSVIKLISQGQSENELVIMMNDRMMLTKHWDRLQADIDKLGNFDIFQMWNWGREPEIARPPNFPKPLSSFPTVSEGLAGAGDACLMLSPRGASRILDWAAEYPFHLIEILLHVKSFHNEGWCVSAINNYEWCRGHISLETLVGLPDSERTALDREGVIENDKSD